MSKTGASAYASVQKQQILETSDPRQIEAAVLTKAAVLLEQSKGDATAMPDALRFNMLLWSIIQADLGQAHNKLPDEIKANVMSLSIFVDKQSLKAMASEDDRDLDSLININRELAAGLRTQPGAGTEAAVAESVGA